MLQQQQYLKEEIIAFPISKEPNEDTTITIPIMQNLVMSENGYFKESLKISVKLILKSSFLN